MQQRIDQINNESTNVQELKKKIAGMALTDRQHYRPVDMLAYTQQKTKLHEMQRDLLKLDKLHIKDQIAAQ